MVRRYLWSSDTGNIPTGRESGPKVFVVEYAERGSPMPSPSGQATRKACCRRYGEKRKEEANAILWWDRYGLMLIELYYLTSKGADVRLVLRCEKVSRTSFR